MNACNDIAKKYENYERRWEREKKTQIKNEWRTVVNHLGRSMQVDPSDEKHENIDFYWVSSFVSDYGLIQTRFFPSLCR